MPLTKFIGFAPDIDPTTPGVITDCQNIIPTTNGYKSLNSPADIGIADIPGSGLGIKQIVTLLGTKRYFVGTGLAIYELVSGSWTDVSRVSGYSGIDPFHTWKFVQFGNTTLAANYYVGTLQSSETGDFADVTGSPSASHIDVASGFVMTANIDGEIDRWKCSAYQDYSDWTPALSTQCVTGRLVDTAGEITGLKALGSRFVIYKKQGLYVGDYVYPSEEIWRWSLVQSDIGCVASESIINVGNVQYFLGDDFYAFDGVRPIQLLSPLRKWFFSDVNTIYISLTKATYNYKERNIYWWYVPNGETSRTKAIVYNIQENKWGTASYEIDDVDYWEYDNAEQMIIIDPLGQVRALTGAGEDAYIVSGNIGDDTQFSLMRRMTPRFSDAPTTATAQLYEDNTYGDSFTAVGSPVSIDSDGRFDVLNSARWHKIKYDFTGSMEIVGVAYDLIPDGEE